jgi:hypothetical protein
MLHFDCPRGATVAAVPQAATWDTISPISLQSERIATVALALRSDVTYARLAQGHRVQCHELIDG